MDQGNGNFRQFDDAAKLESYFVAQFSTLEEKKKAMEKVFHVDEELQVKGSRFRVARITPKKLILRLLPGK